MSLFERRPRGEEDRRSHSGLDEPNTSHTHHQAERTLSTSRSSVRQHIQHSTTASTPTPQIPASSSSRLLASTYVPPAHIVDMCVDHLSDNAEFYFNKYLTQNDATNTSSIKSLSAPVVDRGLYILWVVFGLHSGQSGSVGVRGLDSVQHDKLEVVSITPLDLRTFAPDNKKAQSLTAAYEEAMEIEYEEDMRMFKQLPLKLRLATPPPLRPPPSLLHHAEQQQQKQGGPASMNVRLQLVRNMVCWFTVEDEHRKPFLSKIVTVPTVPSSEDNDDDELFEAHGYSKNNSDAHSHHHQHYHSPHQNQMNNTHQGHRFTPSPSPQRSGAATNASSSIHRHRSEERFVQQNTNVSDYDRHHSTKEDPFPLQQQHGNHSHHNHSSFNVSPKATKTVHVSPARMTPSFPRDDRDCVETFFGEKNPIAHLIQRSNLSGLGVAPPPPPQPQTTGYFSNNNKAATTSSLHSTTTNTTTTPAAPEFFGERFQVNGYDDYTSHEYYNDEEGEEGTDYDDEEDVANVEEASDVPPHHNTNTINNNGGDRHRRMYDDNNDSTSSVSSRLTNLEDVVANLNSQMQIVILALHNRNNNSDSQKEVAQPIRTGVPETLDSTIDGCVDTPCDSPVAKPPKATPPATSVTGKKKAPPPGGKMKGKRKSKSPAGPHVANRRPSEVANTNDDVDNDEDDATTRTFSNADTTPFEPSTPQQQQQQRHHYDLTPTPSGTRGNGMIVSVSPLSPSQENNANTRNNGNFRPNGRLFVETRDAGTGTTNDDGDEAEVAEANLSLNDMLGNLERKYRNKKDH